MFREYFLKTFKKPNNYQFYLLSFLKLCDHISHKSLRPIQFLENLWKFENGPVCRNKSSTFPLLNVAAYWKNSNNEACAKKLSKILTNNNDNRGRGIGFRIYVKYFRLILATIFQQEGVSTTINTVRKESPILGLFFSTQKTFTSLKKKSNRNIKKMCKICSKLTIKRPERCHLCRSGLCIGSFEYVQHFFLVFLVLL